MREMVANRLTFGALVAACAATLLAVTPTLAAPRAAAPRAEGEALPAPAADSWAAYSVEVHGMLISRHGKNAAMLPLVATTSKPIDPGTRAVLFRKVETPQGDAPSKWVEIARVTIEKVEPNRMQLTIDSEVQPPPATSGKKIDYFSKGARLKLAIE